MTQREVTDKENTTWTCVQAYAGVHPEESGSNMVKNKNGTVTVVCTPAGGAQTVRLELEPDWMTSLADEELLQKISTSQK